MSTNAETLRVEIKIAMQKHGLDASVISKQIGRGKDYIGDFLRGKKDSLRADDLSKIRNLIKMEETGSTVSPVGVPSSRFVGMPVKGFVQAGVWQEVDSMGQDLFETYDAAPDLRYPAASQFYLRVRGDSMDAARPIPLPDQSLIKCVSFDAYGADLRTGQIAVIHKFRDDHGIVEATVKRVHVLNGKIEFRPESSNPRHKPIIWDSHTTGPFEEIQVIAIVLDVSYKIE